MTRYARPLIDTSPLGLWGKQPATTSPEPIASESGPTMLQEPPKPIGPQNQCLECGRLCYKMFCSAKCRAHWKASMSRWHGSLSRTELIDQTELPLTP